MNEKRFFGAPASHGIGEGTAFLFSRSTDFEHIQKREISDVEKEVRRIETAIAAAEKEIEGFLRGKTELSDQEHAILKIQLLFLLDKSFTDKILAYAGDGYSAEFSLKSVVDEYIAHFNSLEDAYLRERKKDIRNIGRRILQHLLNTENPDGCKWR
ncbi:MAG: phosphoenolpyruvate-utilizing N-terminal domain-containing protein [Spirochaetia bacterium]|nr:phosphoenolpyruvate-utilizing N-terminal domain-containing protein [Spirochaetia bacterium]